MLLRCGKTLRSHFLAHLYPASSRWPSAMASGSVHTAASAEAGPSRAYPDTRFDTVILRTNPRQPVTFSSPSTSQSEPLQQAYISSCDPQTQASLHLASEAIRSSLPVAFPTETVYGLAANALCTRACKAIFDAKGRPQDNPLIVHVSDLKMAQSITRKGWKAPSVYTALMRRFWPGGITFLVPAAREEAGDVNGGSSQDSTFVGTGTSQLPLMVTANHPLVGIRMPSHPLARALIAQTQLPLAAPSANASGRPSPTTAEHVMYDLGGALDGTTQGRIPYILDGGPCESGVESTVVDGVTEPGELRVLRPGAVSPEEIEQCLCEEGEQVDLRVYGRDIARQQAFEAAPTTPGMKYRHYSPTSPVVLLVTKSGEDAGELSDWKSVLSAQVKELRAARDTSTPLRIGLMLLVDSPLARSVFSQDDSPSMQQWLSGERQRQDEEQSSPLGPQIRLDSNTTLQPFSLGSLSNPSLAARRLFAGLRILDQGEAKVDLILIESVADTGIGLAVMNRVLKAAGEVVQVRA